MEISEKQIENYLKKKVKAAGGLCLKWVSPGTAGVPDRIVILDKQIRLVELKAPARKGNLSAVQKATIRRIQGCGVDVEVLASYEEIDEFMGRLAGDSLGV